MGDILKAIRSFPVSPSGGFGGLRPRHLKDLVSFTCGKAGKFLLKAMSFLVNIINLGNVQADVTVVFFGAS